MQRALRKVHPFVQRWTKLIFSALYRRSERVLLDIFEAKQANQNMMPKKNGFMRQKLSLQYNFNSGDDHHIQKENKPRSSRNTRPNFVHPRFFTFSLLHTYKSFFFLRHLVIRLQSFFGRCFLASAHFGRFSIFHRVP